MMMDASRTMTMMMMLKMRTRVMADDGWHQDGGDDVW